MRGLLNGVFAALWTAAATTAGVVGARVTRDPGFVRSAERVWARRLLQGISLRWHISGIDRFPSPPCLIMANHQSYLDVPLLIAALPVVPGFVAKRELAQVPFLGLAIRHGGHVLLDRSDRQSALSALKAAGTEIRAGKTIAIFPEGTRGDGKRLGAFKRGGFVIAKRARVPIVPVAIRGTALALPRDGRLPQPALVELVIGEPIAPADVARLSSEALSQRVRRAIAALGHLQLEQEALRDAPAGSDENRSKPVALDSSSERAYISGKCR